MPTTRVLIVDDEPRARRLLAQLLEKAGFEVLECGGGREALQLIENGGPMLLVLDYEMPEFTGAQVCELLRQHRDPRIAGLPIIMLTAHAGEDHEIECLRAGADDFVSKPINAAILKARIDTHLRLHAMRAQLQDQNTELEKWRREHERDLEAARLTQQAILPARLPAIPGWDVAAHYQPVIQVGGDIHGWEKQANGNWLFWVADATGHGASAALLTTLTKLVFRHATSEEQAPGAILRAVNGEFHSIFRGRSFITAACAVLAPESGELRFAGAGHPPLFIQHAHGVEALASENPPIGIAPQMRDSEQGTTLLPNDLALLYTDGLFSGNLDDGTHMVPEDLLPFFPPIGPSSEEFLRKTFARASRGAALPDDVAAIALRREALLS